MTNPKFIQTGVVSINYQIQGSGGGGINVTFPTTFDNPPAVVLQPFGLFTANSIEAHVGNTPTTTGFSILGRTAANFQESGSVRWIAFDITKLSIISD